MHGRVQAHTHTPPQRMLQVILNLLRHHPANSALPLIDFTLALALSPILLVGVGVGEMLLGEGGSPGSHAAV